MAAEIAKDIRNGEYLKILQDMHDVESEREKKAFYKELIADELLASDPKKAIEEYDIALSLLNYPIRNEKSNRYY